MKRSLLKLATPFLALALLIGCNANDEDDRIEDNENIEEPRFNEEDEEMIDEDREDTNDRNENEDEIDRKDDE